MAGKLGTRVHDFMEEHPGLEKVCTGIKLTALSTALLFSLASCKDQKQVTRKEPTEAVSKPGNVASAATPVASPEPAEPVTTVEPVTTADWSSSSEQAPDNEISSQVKEWDDLTEQEQRARLSEVKVFCSINGCQGLQYIMEDQVRNFGKTVDEAYVAAQAVLANANAERGIG